MVRATYHCKIKVFEAITFIAGNMCITTGKDNRISFWSLCKQGQLIIDQWTDIPTLKSENAVNTCQFTHTVNYEKS